LLIHCIKKENWFQVLVFIRTKRAADKLAKQLNKQRIKANAIHGNKTQGARTRALKSFKMERFKYLLPLMLLLEE
jgi:ATP-dependent RNA helicase RhlE